MSPSPARRERQSGTVCKALSASASRTQAVTAGKSQRRGSTPLRCGEQSNGTLRGVQVRQEHWKKRDEPCQREFQERAEQMPISTAPQRPARRHRLRPPAEHMHQPLQRHLSEERTIRTQGGTGHSLHWHFPSLTGFLSRRERSLSPQRFRSPFSPQSGRSESRGARQAPGRRACSADICREAGFGHLKPRQKKKNGFQRSEPPPGPLVCASGKSHHSTCYPASFPSQPGP